MILYVTSVVLCFDPSKWCFFMSLVLFYILFPLNGINMSLVLFYILIPLNGVFMSLVLFYVLIPLNDTLCH